MSRKPDTGYSVTCPEVQAEMKRHLWVLFNALGELEGNTSGPFLFFRLYWYSKAFMFVCLSHWKWMYRNRMLENRKERCVIFTEVKGEARFPLVPGFLELYLSSRNCLS